MWQSKQVGRILEAKPKTNEDNSDENVQRLETYRCYDLFIFIFLALFGWLLEMVERIMEN